MWCQLRRMTAAARERENGRAAAAGSKKWDRASLTPNIFAFKRNGRISGITGSMSAVANQYANPHFAWRCSFFSPAYLSGLLVLLPASSSLSAPMPRKTNRFLFCKRSPSQPDAV
jgi:hypothetical protein